MVRAFLSHSSKDKAFIEKVAELLRPGTFELDALTFDKGELNGGQIIASLRRSGLFCFFLSKDSLASKYVDFEREIAIELIAAGVISKFLTVAIDDQAFSGLKGDALFFNAVRKSPTPESAARLIQGKLIGLKAESDFSSHPFIGREDELKILEQQALDFERPALKGLYVSGNSGVGRRSICRVFFRNQFPNVQGTFSTIEVDLYAGFDEIYRRTLSTLRPSMGIKDFVDAAKSFALLSDPEKAERIAREINELQQSGGAAFLLDSGGVLRDSGQLTAEFEQIIDRLGSRPHPAIVIISPRMTPRNKRRGAGDIAYLAVGALSRDNTQRLISWALRSIDQLPNADQMEQLVDLADQHPFNVYEIRERVKDIGVPAFIAAAHDFIAWKHKETSDYIRLLEYSPEDRKIISVLLIAPELDFESVVTATALSESQCADSIQNLIDLHVLRHIDDRFSISPALRVAIERDPRISAEGRLRTASVKRLAKSLTIRIDEETAPISLVDAAILADLEDDSEIGALTSALLLPSHRVWLAKRHYDAGQWKDCMRHAADAIKSKAQLSVGGYVAACRFVCLSATRLNEQATFDEVIRKLAAAANDGWSKANVDFLRGFNARVRGRVLDAERHYVNAHKQNSNDRSTARELASVYLILGDSVKAEKFARAAYSLATHNPFTIDILVSALVRSLGARCLSNPEVNSLLERLAILDKEDGRSFSSTRNAEIALLYGDATVALREILTARRITPYLFEPRLLHARILLKQGNRPDAWTEIKGLEEFVARKQNNDNRSNLRQVLELKADYYIETGQYSEARRVYSDRNCFSESEAIALIKEVDVAESFAGQRRP